MNLIKKLSIALLANLFLLTALSFAQEFTPERGIRKIRRQIDRLDRIISRYDLTRTQMDSISNYLRDAIHVAQDEPKREIFCNANKLIDTEGNVIAVFNFSSDCITVANEIRNGAKFFCNANKLEHLRWGSITTFNFSSDCITAKTGLQNGDQYFCNANKLMTRRGRTVTTFNFSSECITEATRLNNRRN